MATKKPLVHYSGSIRELAASDRLDYVKLTGDTMTGNLLISASNPQFNLTKAVSGEFARISAYMGANPRWVIDMGDATTEALPASGSHFRIYRYNNAGAQFDGANGAFAIARDDGTVYIYNRLTVSVMRLGSYYSGGATSAATINMSSDLSSQSNAIIAENNGARRWTVELGNVSAQDFVIARWNGGSLLNIPMQINWSTGTFSTSGTWNHTGDMAANRHLYQGSQTALVPQSGTWFTSGAYRINYVWDNASGQGDVSYAGSYHQPGVDSFFQLNQGGGGAYFRFANNGWGYSNNGWTTHSDVFTKYDIRRLDNVRERVEGLPAYLFKKKGDPLKRDIIGTIAQAARPRNPEMIHEAAQLPWTNAEGKRMRVRKTLLAADYGQAAMVAVAGAADLYARLDAALSRIAVLESMLGITNEVESQ